MMEGLCRFYDPHDNMAHTYCDMKIQVDIKRYTDGREYYDISYSYMYDERTCIINEITNDTSMVEMIEKHKTIRTNPFYYHKSMIRDDSFLGVIVFKNTLTDKLVEYLLMSDKDLDSVSGNTWSVQYRANIMLTLALMWD